MGVFWVLLCESANQNVMFFGIDDLIFIFYQN